MEQRRQFIKKVVAGGIAASAFPYMIVGNESGNQHRISVPQQDTQPVRLALIGKGSQGTSDTRAALQVPGVKLVAVCDLYDVRLQAAKKLWGDSVFLTRDYKEIISRSDIDAVIVATSDHWHKQISIEAMQAGKHVYCEKPVIHKIDEARELVKAQQVTGRVFQAGSQGMASIGNRKAKQLVQSGAIGRVNLVEAAFTSAPRSYCRNVPVGIAAADVWWERYITNAPKVPFEPSRFFCWRHWKDYGTGIAGDLFVHVLSSLQYIMNANGPEKVYTTGDLDGVGDTPYIMLGYFDYPARAGMQAFKAALSANYADNVSKKWGSVDFTITGSEGIVRVQWDRVTLKKPNATAASDYGNLPTLGNTIDKPQQISDNELLFHEEGYNRCHVDHLANFINGIRNGAKIEADVNFAVQSAVPAIMCFESYLSGNPVYWDAENLKTKKQR